MKTLALAWTCLLLAIPCSADVISVDPNGTGDYPTIQAAIDAASVGDTVIVAGRIYTENVSCVSEITIHFTQPTTINGQVTTGTGTDIIADADLTINSDSDITLGGPVTIAGMLGLYADGDIVISNTLQALEIEMIAGVSINVGGSVNGTGSVDISAGSDITGTDVITGSPVVVEITGSIPVIVAGIIYVDKDAAGSGDGSSWDDAFTKLQSALDVAWPGNEIWVVAGTYKPGTVRTSTFQLKNCVALYGGFAGGETNLDERDWETNETVLSGDLSDNDNGFTNNGENSYHVVTGSGTNDTAVLNGFTITGGNANGSGGCPACTDHGGGMFNWDNSSPTVANCTFSGNSAKFGGGMFNGWYSSPKVTNCTFRGNMTKGTSYSPESGGAGMANDSNSSPHLTNCIFSGNRAVSVSWSWGGGLANSSSDPCLVNCTFIANKAHTQGGGINNWNSSSKVTNCILWGNAAPSGAQIYGAGAGSTTVTYSDIQGGWPGEGNIDDDPNFVDADGPDNIVGTEDDNLRLFLFSPCIDAGDNSVVDPCSTDLDGNPRIMDGNNDSNSVVDMGAYELLTPIEANVHIVPRVINRNNRLKRVMAIVRLPEGINKDDLIPESFELYVGGLDSEPIGAILERVIGWGNMTRVFALFDKAELMDAAEGVGRVELTVVGKLESGQYIYGSDTVRIIQPRRRQRRRLRLR